MFLLWFLAYYTVPSDSPPQIPNEAVPTPPLQTSTLSNRECQNVRFEFVCAVPAKCGDLFILVWEFSTVVKRGSR